MKPEGPLLHLKTIKRISLYTTFIMHVITATYFGYAYAAITRLKIGPCRGELSYLAPLGSENISAPYFKQCFFRGGLSPPPQTESNTTPTSPKTSLLLCL